MQPLDTTYNLVKTDHVEHIRCTRTHTHTQTPTHTHGGQRFVPIALPSGHLEPCPGFRKTTSNKKGKRCRSNVVLAIEGTSTREWPQPSFDAAAADDAFEFGREQKLQTIFEIM